MQDLVSDDVLRAYTDEGTRARGLRYARENRVASLSVARNGQGVVIQSSVAGSSAAPYQTVVSARRKPGDDVELYAACSCPVGRFCKHAVATLVVAREQDGPAHTPETSSTPQWERVLTALVDDLDAQQSHTVLAETAVALRFEISRTPTSASRYAQWSGTAGARRPRLRVRPVAMGARGRWVKSAIGWSDVVYADQYPRERYPPAHLDLLRELAVASRSGSRHAHTSDSNAERDLHAFGPSLWRLLRDAEDVGLPLVGEAPLTQVRVAAHAASLRLDLTRTATDKIEIRPGVELDGTWTEARDVVFIGEPAHGVALWGEEADDGGTTVTLAALEERPAAAAQRMVAREEVVEVPAEQVGDLLGEYIPQVRRLLPVFSHDASLELPEPVLPRLGVVVSWSGDGQVDLSWTWRYRDGDTDRTYALSSPPTAARDVSCEQAILDRLVLSEEETTTLCDEVAHRPSLVPEQRLRGMEAVRFAEQVLPGLHANGQVEVDVLGKQPEFREARGAPEVRFATVESKEDGRTDWLELEVVVSVDDVQIGLAPLLEALTAGEEQILLHDGVYVSLDRPEFDGLARLLADARALQEQPRNRLRLSSEQLDLWTELAELGVVDEQAARWTRTARALADVTELPEVVEPAGLQADLRPYQCDGYRWLCFLYDHGLGGILADDMGLGKTLQTLALVEQTRQAGRRTAPFLVVAPTSVVATWAGEARTFTPDLTVRTITESHTRRGTSIADVAGGVDIVVTSYTLLRLEIDAYLQVPWAAMVLDEAQTVKNHRAKTHQCVRRVDAPFKLAITGTPMENNLMELWALLSITAPGLFPHPGRFAEKFANPIERESDTDRLATLRRRVRPLMLRRTKELVAGELPPKQEQVLRVDLTPRHRKIYDTHLQRERQKILGLVGDLDEHRITILSSLTRLRQLSLDAALVDHKYDSVASAKIDTLVEHLREVAAEGHRALVFSQFTGFLRRVRDRLGAEGIEHAYLDGTTRHRDQVIAGFKDGDQPAFLVSLKAGGVGLTLTEADYCFLLDPWWNPAVEAQAVDRTHRIGQTQHVLVYRLVATATIEEKVMDLKARKGELFSSVMDEDAMMSAPLTAADIAALLED